ncbi:hypothetical protein [Paractinoplanes abujensis]|uniref:Uncharacterized protein n=1 Tax=Paractinoplanes abujensis TaxID=882441 RepID=A0A7W7G2J9_9ACTN|nr:hypothetical protein [Actinoplanes abujensis]MBB4693877.1 hypothetical protein [Actinoplanes abujensis]
MMNKLTRALTLGGFGVLTALTVGMGPAQAAPAAPAGPATADSKITASQNMWRGESQIVGFYRSLRACQLAGMYGERSGAWDDFDCYVVRVGPRRGAWALDVADYDNWGSFGFGRPFQVVRGFPAQFRPVWAGQFRQVRPGQFRHFRPGSHRSDWMRDRDRRHGGWDRDRHHGGWDRNDGRGRDNDGRGRDNDGRGNQGNGPRGDQGHGPRGNH